MSIGEKITSDEIEDALQRLFAGREPKAAWLARCATIAAWRLHVREAREGKRAFAIDGTLTSGRFTIKDQPRMPALVLWMDRKLRFVVTTRGLWNLGEQERAVDMNLKLPPEEKADD